MEILGKQTKFFKNMKKILVLVAAMTAGICAMQAQTNFTLFLGGSMPTGEFAESDMDREEWVLISNEKGGGAGTGFNIGLQWNFNIQSVQGLSILFSIDGIMNTVNSDIKDYLEDIADEEDDEGDEFNYTLPKYLNFPVMVGASYSYGLNQNISLYGEAAMGLAFRKITNLSIHEEYERTRYDDDYNPYKVDAESDETYEYDFSTSFAYRFGAGFIINNKYNIGVSLWNLGASKVKGTARWEEKYDGERDTDKGKFKTKNVTPTMIMFRLGISL